MAGEETPPVVDQAGIQRTADGTIPDGQTTQVDQQSSQNTDQTQKTDQQPSLLNRKADATATKADAKPEDKSGDKKAEAKTGAPEKYEPYTLPDGYVIDPEVEGKANGLFKEMGLNQEQAQKLVDFYRETTEAAFRQPFEAYQEMINDQIKESLAHPELKGKLEPGEEINVRIGKFLDSYPDQKTAQAFRDEMDLTGAGSHWAFISVFNHLVKQVTEGGHVSGKGPSPGGQSEPGKGNPPSAAAAMWPNLPSAQKG